MDERVLSIGSGVPVVAIHGWGPDRRLMTGCLEPIFERRAGYRRLYPNLPGFGGTPATGVNSTADLVDAVEDALAAELAGAPFLLVGESFGGYVARELVRRRPGRVLGLALICPLGAAVRRDERTLPPHRAIARDEAFLAGLDPLTRADFDAIGVVQTPATYAAYARDVAPGLDLFDAVAAARIERAWELPTPPESGPAYPGPTLWLTGRQDAVVGYANQWALLEHYPRATFAVLDRAGHNLQFEQPALFAALVGEWLDRVAEAGILRP